MWNNLRKQTLPHEAAHSPEAIRQRLNSNPDHNYLKDFIYGAIDGAVTTFAIVSGVAGAGLSSGIIVILGLANLLGDGFSMAMGNFLGTRADQQLRAKARREEQEHIELYPEGEREEIRQIFAQKGFTGKDLDRVVEVITSDPKRWVDTMLKEELGYSLHGPSPIKAALTTFFAFSLIGLIPLISFLVDLIQPGLISRPFLWSSVLTGLAFLLVGVLKSRTLNHSWVKDGLETLFIGGCAAGLAYLIGYSLKGLAT